jgi:hypothetical protein
MGHNFDLCVPGRGCVRAFLFLLAWVAMSFSPVRTFFKALGLAAVCGAIGFFAGVFLSIVGIALYGWLAKQQPDFTMTYKFFGAPFGALVFMVVLVGVWVRDVRRVA